MTNRIFKSLRIHRNYRLFFAGQVISLAGTWMQNIALAWFVVELTDSPLAVGGLAFCRFLPFMLFGLYAGVIADRLDNRKLVMATQAAQMGVSAALTVLAFSGWENIPIVYFLAFLGGSALVLDAPGRQALTFQMVGRDELPNAIALNTGLFNGSRIIGPAIAGVIIGLGGTGICFLVNTITFLAVLTALALMRKDELFEVKRNPRTRAGAAIAEGVRFAWNNSEIRLALTVLAIASTVGFNFHVIIPVLASDTLNAGPEVFGVLSAFFGGGALLGALIQAARSKASWKALLIGATGFSAGLLALAPGRDGRAGLRNSLLRRHQLHALGLEHERDPAAPGAGRPARPRDEPLHVRLRGPRPDRRALRRLADGGRRHAARAVARRLAVARRRRVRVDSAGRADARAQSPTGLSIWRSDVIVSTSSRS